MKVKYAVQVLSSSVSYAICMCRTDLELNQFRDSRATEEFITLLNDLFDILNSRNLRQQKYKRPINLENYLGIEKKLSECKTYILNLTTKNGQKLTQSPRKIGFLGLLICIESITKLYADICKTEYVSHIP